MSDPTSAEADLRTTFPLLAQALSDLFGWVVLPYLWTALAIGAAYFTLSLYHVSRWTQSRLARGTDMPAALRLVLPSDGGKVPLIFQRPVIILYTGGLIAVNAAITLFLATFWIIPAFYLAVAFAGNAFRAARR